MTVWKWSQTAATNATADSNIDLAEGMAPSEVNDAARAQMAAIAKYRDDLAGMITTGGSSTAYTVTSNQTLTALTNGFTVAFIPHATSGSGGVTLAVDGLTAKPLRQFASVNLRPGALASGSKYTATYRSATEEWLLNESYAPSVKAWGVVILTGSSAALQEGFNVASVARNAAGEVGVTLTNAISTATYAVVATMIDPGASGGVQVVVAGRTTTVISFRTSTDTAAGNTAQTNTDYSFMFVALGT